MLCHATIVVNKFAGKPRADILGDSCRPSRHALSFNRGDGSRAAPRERPWTLEDAWFVTALHLSRFNSQNGADSHGSPVGPFTTLRGRLRCTVPPSHPRPRSPPDLRSHTSRVACPRRLRSPRRAIRDHVCAVSRMAPLGEGSRPSRTDLSLRGFQLSDCSCSRSSSKRLIVSTSDDTSRGFCKNTSAPASRAAASTGLADRSTIGVSQRWSSSRA